MENLENLSQEYKDLKSKLDDIALKDFGMDENGGFPSSSKFKSYVEKNKNSLEKLKALREQIQQLKYDLKTPEEKKEYDEYLRKLKLKSEGKPLI